MFNYFNASRRVLVAIGLIFILSGLIIGGLNIAIRTKALQGSGSMPSISAAIGFEVLGLLGLVAAYFGLRSAKAWAWFACAGAYLPWTVRGFVSDTRQGLWPLVIGEAVGLVLTILALFFTARGVFQRPGRGTHSAGIRGHG
jgi:hypothetical protein